MFCLSTFRIAWQYLHRVALCGGVGILLLVGCGGPGDRPELGTVSGAITQEGKPLADAWVIFEPEEGRISAGRTDEEGHYSLEYSHGVPGARTGTHTVKIGTGRDQSGALDRSKMTRAGGGGGRKQIFERSGVKVDAGENVIDFEVTENNTYKPPVANPRGRGRRGR